MANFGFSHLNVVAPYEPHWREARSAVGAPKLLANAAETASLSEAVRDCTLVLGTGTVMHRKPEQPLIRLNDLAPVVAQEMSAREGRIGLVFGPEKHGLTREDLSWCHYLIEIPTDRAQPSMNLGQAAAVCLYELATRVEYPETGENQSPPANASSGADDSLASGKLDTLADLIEEVMIAAEYSPKNMQDANRHDLRLMLRRVHLNAVDHRRTLGIFRRILWRLRRDPS